MITSFWGMFGGEDEGEGGFDRSTKPLRLTLKVEQISVSPIMILLGILLFLMCKIREIL